MLVLDANILIRAVLGVRVLDILRTYSKVVRFAVTDVAASDAKELISDRDDNDWPTLASALALTCPIWTEDQDFFGLGVPIWKSSRVELLLKRRMVRN